MTNKLTSAASRRKFLKGAAVAGVASVAMPQVSRAQTVTLKMQSGFGATDPLNLFGENYSKHVNEMGGGRLKIDYLSAGSVVKPFSVMDATSQGVLDGNWSVPAYWYGKHRAASLFGTGPCYGQTASNFMSWFYYGGGQALYDELTQKILKLNVQGFYAFAMPTQPLGWFKKELHGPNDFKGMKYRTVGLASNVMQAMGASVAQLPGPEILPAMEKGVIEAFEYNNPTSDMRFGAQDVAKYYYLGSYHQASEAIEVVYNKTKWDGLAAEQRQILKLAAMSSNSDNIWNAWDMYSKDLEVLQNKYKIIVKRTSEAIFKAQLAAWDKVVNEISSDPHQGPFVKKVLDSQKVFFKRVAFYDINNAADYKSAWEHYFGAMKV
jgi:TRAP-type mannitol/chloroaromatic compound transport system substrate-binding protein